VGLRVGDIDGDSVGEDDGVAVGDTVQVPQCARQLSATNGTLHVSAAMADGQSGGSGPLSGHIGVGELVGDVLGEVVGETVGELLGEIVGDIVGEVLGEADCSKTAEQRRQ
jgi:hypothetical protein